MDAASFGIRVSIDELIALGAAAPDLSHYSNRGRGPLAGAYRSALRGRGIEFEEVRGYQAGDDIRSIDWRVTARTDRPHTKVFREERERPVLLCVDVGATMRFGTRVAFKSVTAVRLAALLGWAALARHDRLGALVFSGEAHQELRPGSGRRALLRCLGVLAGALEAPASQPSRLDTVLQRLRYIAAHGGLIALISDFVSLEEADLRHLTALARHNEVLALQVYDPIEAELPPPGRYAFTDGRHAQALWTGDAALRARYREEFFARSARLEGELRSRGIRWWPVPTSSDPAAELQRRLGSRAGAAAAERRGGPGCRLSHPRIRP